MITDAFTMMQDMGSTIAVMSTAALFTMRIAKTLQAPPWASLPLHPDVRAEYLSIVNSDVGKVGIFPIAPKDVKADCFPIVDNDVGKVGIFPNDPRDVRAEYLPIVDNDVGKDGNFPIAPKDVKTGNFHTALSDVGPGTLPHTHTDVTLHQMFPNANLRQVGQVHFTFLHPRLQVIHGYPRGPEEVGTRNSFSLSECFSGDISSLGRESKRTTCPALNQA